MPFAGPKIDNFLNQILRCYRYFIAVFLSRMNYRQHTAFEKNSVHNNNVDYCARLLTTII